MKLEPAVLEEAQRHYAESLNDENRRVRDPIITPFAMAMRLSGYKVVMTVGGCDQLRECPTCGNKYSTKYEKDGALFWGCPHCAAVTPDEGRRR